MDVRTQMSLRPRPCPLPPHVGETSGLSADKTPRNAGSSDNQSMKHRKICLVPVLKSTKSDPDPPPTSASNSSPNSSPRLFPSPFTLRHLPSRTLPHPSIQPSIVPLNPAKVRPKPPIHRGPAAPVEARRVPVERAVVAPRHLRSDEVGPARDEQPDDGPLGERLLP